MPTDDAAELVELLGDLWMPDGSPKTLTLHRLRYLDAERTPEQSAAIATAWQAVADERRAAG